MSVQNEEQEQIKIFQWASYQTGLYPELKLLHHIPNGGERNRIVAAKLKAAGVKRGVPDISLPVARGGYHGLYIELKYDDGRPTTEQKAWHDALIEQGYKAVFCWGFEEAIEVIKEYLKLK